MLTGLISLWLHEAEPQRSHHTRSITNLGDARHPGQRASTMTVTDVANEPTAAPPTGIYLARYFTTYGFTPNIPPEARPLAAAGDIVLVRATNAIEMRLAG
jgi:hypothetical protein